MPKLYTFGCTFNVVKLEHCTWTDMQLAQEVHLLLQDLLKPTAEKAGLCYFVVESIHPIMVGPEGGVDIEE